MSEQATSGQTVISKGSFVLQRDAIMAFMLDQRDASAKVVSEKTGLWRKLRLSAIVLMLIFLAAAILTKKGPHVSQLYGAVLVMVVIAKIFDLLVKRGMGRLGARSKVSRTTIAKAMEKRIFKGRAQVSGKASFGEHYFELEQDGVLFSAGYDDMEKIGLIFERHGIVQITAGDARGLPDVIFFIPLEAMSNPEGLMARLQQSPSFVWPREVLEAAQASANSPQSPA